MAKRRSLRVMAFGDVHIPHHSAAAVSVVARVVERVKPDILICLGDLLDCSPWSRFPLTYGAPESHYADDIALAGQLLGALERWCGRLVLVEGNHEYRLARWAANSTEGRGAHSMLSPRTLLMRGRRSTTRYIPYGGGGGSGYPHYAINARLVAVHGWTAAKSSARQHLAMSQGRSVIYGHTHRADVVIVQDIWSPSQVVQARGAGCLCQPVPMYDASRPSEWVNAFVLGYCGRRSDTLYTIPIMGDRCILPDGTEIRA